MTKIKSISILICILASASNTHGQQTELLKFPALEGPFMGQKPPGLVAERFAPDIISKGGWEREGVFAPGMKEFYFTLDLGQYDPNDSSYLAVVVGFKMTGNTWNKFIEFPRQGELAFSADGQRMLMANGYMERTATGWSERKSLGPMFDREDWGIMRLTTSRKGTYVFDDFKNPNSIRISEVINGVRQAPELLSTNINEGKFNAHPFIAPDESYLIWDCEREGGYGRSDLYISFKQDDGSWGPGINMGEAVNSEKGETFAQVTPDGQFILFSRSINQETYDTDIYWVDAKIIETLRPKS